MPKPLRMYCREFIDLYRNGDQWSKLDWLEIHGHLKEAKRKFKPKGFIIAVGVMMDSSRFGELRIFPYGPQNTFKTIPEQLSFNGLPSGSAKAVAYILAKDVRGHFK